MNLNIEVVKDSLSPFRWVVSISVIQIRTALRLWAFVNLGLVWITDSLKHSLPLDMKCETMCTWVFLWVCCVCVGWTWQIRCFLFPPHTPTHRSAPRCWGVNILVVRAVKPLFLGWKIVSDPWIGFNFRKRFFTLIGSKDFYFFWKFQWLCGLLNEILMT